MLRKLFSIMAIFATLTSTQALADDYSDTVANFKSASETAQMFSTARAYAVFPTIGKGGIGIGGAHGKGRVFVNGQSIGETKMSQLSIGLQLGGQAYSQIIFFENQAALDNFTSGNFEFSAGASAIAITASAQAQAGTSGSSANAGSSSENSNQAGITYNDGMAVVTMGKGGLMYEASIAGQKYSFKAK
ncbi:hypothetical protein ACS86_14965 [Vibrio alginolyticus]|nr:hypothetical protein ACS86_14965 [Vibrio alginolyticus]